MTFEIILHSLSYLEITMLILPLQQFHFKLINQHFIPLKLTTLKQKPVSSAPRKLQTHFKAVPTALVIHLHRLTDVKSPVYNSAFPLWFTLWFNQSWSIIYYIKEIALQQQGSESKRISAGGLLSKEGGRQWVSHTLPWEAAAGQQ